ncbi:glycine zipper 2TM domain-containing protein [Ralstonia solanacearum]|uniref:Glycine zipper 2TM domain-containing protein n=1 Tax=Ralstonia solanacearum TaxID=305 RepID=A0AAE3T6T1_RALSL|nr:glycine zipper 2TM domain-containing protein [Ralstonia solanacearum]MBB6580926.1 glycine zipper 2TM domain-containing protein [Ralstonia solanacearum]MDB0524293.1 glycine zipper 2TM domain-containing protein [Ralstonia solanacearum]
MNNMQPNIQGQQYAGASLGQVPQSRRMHPLAAGAAIAVIIASVTAVAAITGVLPTSKATQGNTNPNVAAQASTAPSASAPLALAAPNQAAPAYPAQPNAVRHAVHHPAPSYAEHNPSSSNADYAQPRPAASPYAGQVTAVTPITTQQGNETGLGMIGGAVVGGLLGNQVGKGNGRTLATVAGAVGGGYAGHEAENYYHRDTSYNVSVRMDNGATRTFTYKAAPGFQVGDRVHVENGSLAAG